MRYLELAGGSATWQTPARSGGPSRGAPQAPRSRPARRRDRGAHPVRRLLGRRAAAGLFTLCVVSVLVFAATEVLPGNAANAVLGRTAASSPAALHRLEAALHLNRGLLDQYWLWFSGLVTGHLGHSLVNGRPVWGYVAPRLINSAVLMGVTGLIGVVAGVGLGALAALRRDGWLDHVFTVTTLAVTALPEFVVAIGLIILFVHGGHPPAAGGVPAAAGQLRLERPAPADPAGGHPGHRDRAVHPADDAGGHDRGAGVRLRGNGPAEGSADVAHRGSCTRCPTPPHR